MKAFELREEAGEATMTCPFGIVKTSSARLAEGVDGKLAVREKIGELN
jgi:hypothetical protein